MYYTAILNKKNNHLGLGLAPLEVMGELMGISGVGRVNFGVSGVSAIRQE